jgi:hypothetical protein
MYEYLNKNTIIIRKAIYTNVISCDVNRNTHKKYETGENESGKLLFYCCFFPMEEKLC